MNNKCIHQSETVLSTICPFQSKRRSSLFFFLKSCATWLQLNVLFGSHDAQSPFFNQMKSQAPSHVKIPWNVGIVIIIKVQDSKLDSNLTWIEHFQNWGKKWLKDFPPHCNWVLRSVKTLRPRQLQSIPARAAAGPGRLNPDESSRFSPECRTGRFQAPTGWEVVSPGSSSPPPAACSGQPGGSAQTEMGTRLNYIFETIFSLCFSQYRLHQCNSP